MAQAQDQQPFLLRLPHIPPAIQTLRNYFYNNGFVDVVFPSLTPREALMLMRSAYIWRPTEEYAIYINTCESGQPPVVFVPHNDFILQTVRVFAAANIHACGNRAVFHNNYNAGRLQPSFCEINDRAPGNPFGPAGNPGSHHQFPNGLKRSLEPLVCTSCKQARRQNWEWRREELYHGACAACETWAITNIHAMRTSCTCVTGPFWRHPGNVNNWDEIVDHMCFSHHQWLWNGICHNADQELAWRRQRVPKKKRGHGWTRPKGKV